MRGDSGDSVGKKGHRGGRLERSRQTRNTVVEHEDSCGKSLFSPQKDIKLCQEVMVSEYFHCNCPHFLYIKTSRLRFADFWMQLDILSADVVSYETGSRPSPNYKSK